MDTHPLYGTTTVRRTPEPSAGGRGAERADGSDVEEHDDVLHASHIHRRDQVMRADLLEQNVFRPRQRPRASIRDAGSSFSSAPTQPSSRKAGFAEAPVVRIVMAQPAMRP